MATLTDMINEVSMNLSGYTLQQDRATHITADVAATASTIAPYGRAYLGTTLAAHTAGVKVTIAPTFPRFTIKRAINDTINAIGASIFAAKTTTITSNAAVAAFRLPTTVTLDTTADSLNINKILSIAYQTLGASKEWTPIRSYRFDGNANSTAFTSGQTVSIYDYIPSGRTIQIVYATDPSPFTTNADVFTTQTGLPESCRDIIILGATYRLLSNLDPARASMVSPQADETDSKRPYGSSQSLTRQVYTLFTQRLNEEVKSQQEKYPIRVHYSL